MTTRRGIHLVSVDELDPCPTTRLTYLCTPRLPLLTSAGAESGRPAGHVMLLEVDYCVPCPIAVAAACPMSSAQRVRTIVMRGLPMSVKIVVSLYDARNEFWHMAIGRVTNVYKIMPPPSHRHHRSNGDCLEVKRENYQVCSVQHCVQHCTQ